MVSRIQRVIPHSPDVGTRSRDSIFYTIRIEAPRCSKKPNPCTSKTIHYAVEYRARVPQESQFAKPHDPVFGASIDVGNIYNAVSGVVHPSNHPGDRVFITRQQSVTSTKKTSVLPSKSEAPARTLRSKPSASILTISGNGAFDEETISFRVLTETEICELRRPPAWE